MMLPYTIPSASAPAAKPAPAAVRSISRTTLALAIFLAILPVFVLGLPPDPQVHAASFPGTAGVPAEPGSQASFESWLIATGRPVFSRIHGYRASFASYKVHNLLLYGEPAAISGNTCDPVAGYAVLGYSYDEIKVPNPLYPSGGTAQSTPWDWVELDMGQSARLSWSRLSEREKYFIKSAGLTYRGQTYGSMTFSQLQLAEETTVVLAPPSWHLGFALYTSHNQASSRVYATFNGTGAGRAEVRSKITMQTLPASGGAYIIDRDLDAIDISYTVSGEIVAFRGKTREVDVHNRGAGNDSGWTSGSGIGPWDRKLTLRVSRADLGGQLERQFTLAGNAWLVSRFGDIELNQFSRTIKVQAEPAALPFAVDIALEGSIRYFSGQTNARGQTMPLDPHRFLVYERMKVIMEFTRDPLTIDYAFNGVTGRINGIADKRRYEITLVLPRWPSTLSWKGERQANPLTLTVRANARSAPTTFIQKSVNDIELTGDIFDITHYQVR